MDISLNSMLPVMTTDMEERNMLSSLKGVVYMVGMFGLNMIAPIIIGNTTEAAGYIRLVIFVTIIVVVFSVVGAVGLKERVTQQPGDSKYKLKDLFKILVQRPVIVTFLSSLAYMIGMSVTNTMLAYFFTYVIGNLSLISVVSLVQLLALIPASLLVGKLIQKFGKKKLYAFGVIAVGVIPLIRLIDVTNVPILMIATIAGGFASGLCMPLSYGIQADNTDYVNLKMNVHAEAAVAALSSFITKCAMGIGGAIPGYMLAAVGFDSAAAQQPDGVKTVIIIGAIVIPAVLGILGSIIFAGAYPLTKEKLEAQAAEMKEVREKNVSL